MYQRFEFGPGEDQNFPEQFFNLDLENTPLKYLFAKDFHKYSLVIVIESELYQNLKTIHFNYCSIYGSKEKICSNVIMQKFKVY